MFEKRLRALREEQGFQSQQSLADALGVAQSTVANWECGRREPNYETTRKLADFFQAAFPGFTGSHAAIQRHSTGVSNSTAGRRGKEDFRTGNGAAA